MPGNTSTEQFSLPIQNPLDQLIHDLRTNLHAIEVAVSLLESEASPDADGRADVMQLLKQELQVARTNLETLVAEIRSGKD